MMDSLEQAVLEWLRKEKNTDTKDDFADTIPREKKPSSKPPPRVSLARCLRIMSDDRPFESSKTKEMRHEVY